MKIFQDGLPHHFCSPLQRSDVQQLRLKLKEYHHYRCQVSTHVPALSSSSLRHLKSLLTDLEPTRLVPQAQY